MTEGPRRQIGVTAAGLALAGGAALLFGWLSEEVLEGETSRFDAWVRAAVHAATSPTLTAVMRFFTDLGSVAGTACLLAIALLVFWLRRWQGAAMTLAVTMAGAALLDGTLKLGFHRQRPTPWFGMTAPHSFSYPSGHALLAFAFYATVPALATARLAQRPVRVLIWAAAASIAGLIGYSRVYLGMHYPSDVIAGYLTGLIWVVTVALGDRLRRSGTQ